MEVITEKIGAGVAAVAVKNAEEAALWPVFDVFLGRRLHDVQHDAYSILVIVSNDALVCVCGVANYASIFADAAFGGLPARKIQSCWIRWRSVPQQERLDIELLLILLLFLWRLQRRLPLRIGALIAMTLNY